MTLNATYSTANKIQNNITLIICGIGCSLAYGYLAMHSQAYGQAQLQHLLLSCGSAFIFNLIAWFHCWRMKFAPSAIIIVLFAILFRIIGMLTFPVLEDDIYRYLWDGRMTITNGNPYNQIPADFFSLQSNGLISDQFQLILGNINYPDIATVYGPVLQWLFAICYLIAPGEIWPLKLFIIAADIGIIMLLFKVAPRSFVLLYAWSPLIIKEFAITAHPDIIGVLFLLSALIAHQKGASIRIGILLALAAGVKIFALIAVPLLLRPTIKKIHGSNNFFLNKSITHIPWRGWLAMLITGLLLSSPWGVIDTWFPAGLRAMGSDWLFNAPLTILPLNWLSLSVTKAILISAFLLFAAYVYCSSMLRVQPQSLRTNSAYLSALFGVMLACSPALNPWYIAWLLPFGVIAPRIWIWLSSAVIFLAYLSGINLSDKSLQAYEHPTWVLILELCIIMLALILDFYLRRHVAPKS